MTSQIESLVVSQSDLLEQVAALLEKHPSGRFFRLMFAPATVPVGTDEVLVQVENSERGVIELQPRKLSELDSSAVVHDSQTLDPADEEFKRYGSSPIAAKCLKRRNLHGQTVHIYD